jgi:tetratricopeptide (TPR) repeat protein
MRSSPQPSRVAQPTPRPLPVPPGGGLRPLSDRALLIVSLCCVLFVFAVYSRSLGFQFVLDDHRFTSDPRIQESGHLWDYFANYVWAQFTGGPSSFYRPVFVLWMRINFALSGLSPWGWHLLSIAKHALVAGLLGLLVWKLLRDGLAALLAAMLFALHPAQTESVSWVTVPDPLMAAGVLAALLLYFRYLHGAAPLRNPKERNRGKHSRGESSRRSTAWLIASAVTYFLSLLAKETAIIFPAIIFVLGACLPDQGAVQRLSKKDGLKAPVGRAFRHVAPFLCATAVYLLLRFNALGGKFGAATQHLRWRTVVLSWPAILWFYVEALLWPVHSYSFADPRLAETFSLRGVLLPLAAVACFAAILAGAGLWAWRKSSRELGEPAGVKFALLAGILLLVLPLLLTLNLNALNPGDFLHGRYTYLPLCGLMLLAGVDLRLAGRLRVTLSYVAVGLMVAFAALTYSQEAQWKDDATVFTVAHRLAPNNAPVTRNLANTHLQAALQMDEDARCNEALPVFQEVIRDYPQDWYAWAGLGDCFVQLNDLPKAEEAFHRAVDLSHNPQVIQHWQELRAHMGLSPPASPN